MPGSSSSGAALSPPLPYAVPLVSESASRRWAIGAHLGALLGGFLLGVPAIIGPLIVWLVRKDVDTFAAAHARAALNFNVSVLIYSAILVFLTVMTAGLGVLFTVPAGIILGLIWLVCSIRGAVLAANDHLYRYPFAIPFLH
ncbi:MAG: DUF4870 domain-containing protein [Chloroflexota bacterium]|nr:DUF4870 domain-containing protein [Chloroflexota bacterium]